jgi:uncharacterized phage protein gp47/JayE
MAYSPPTITAAGLSIPSYIDIRDDLVATAKTIFGADIYLGNDSMDYQYISAIALKISDDMQGLQLAYNNRSPVTAIGSGLDAIVKINGIARKKPSYSTCQVTLTGTAGAIISNGVAGDISGNNWSLPASVTIGSGGTITVSATCQVIGSIPALVGNINKIVTPTAGWISVINNVVAIAGQPVEKDSQLRARQAISTSLPSQTLLDGTIAGIASVQNVTRWKVYENDTNIVDSNGLPAHSITCVVEGGTDTDIAQQIYSRKGIGCYTNGTTIVSMIDAYGIPTAIRFYRPSYVPIDVTISVKRFAGYTDANTAQIKQNVADYLSSLKIGDDLAVSSLWYASLAVNPDIKNPIFSITSLTAGKHGQSQGTADIITLFNEVTQGNILNVTVNVT